MMHLPEISCAVCDKLVDQVRVHYDICTMATVYKVRCHGETDTCEITDQDMIGMGKAAASLAMAKGTAFVTKRLEVD